MRKKGICHIICRYILIYKLYFMIHSFFVPETCISYRYLSDSCKFENCSESPPSPFVFYNADLPNQCIGTKHFYTVRLLHESSARWCSWPINMREYGNGGDATASSEILRKMTLIILSYLILFYLILSYLIIWALKSLFGPKAGKMALLSKKIPMGGVVFMQLSRT